MIIIFFRIPHTSDADLQHYDIPVAPNKEDQYVSPTHSPTAKTIVENENHAEGADDAVSDLSFRPSDGEFESDSDGGNEDIENNNITGVTNQLESSDTENEVVEGKPDQQKKKRNASAKPEEWKCNKNKFKRMKGEKYNGVQKNQSGRKNYCVDKPARKMGLPCSSTECRRVKTRECPRILEVDRESLFTRFWQHMDWNQRKVYISSLVSFKERNRVRKVTESPSRRKGTLHYNLKINDELHPVCKSLFLSTFGLREWTVRNWVMKGKDGMHQDRIIRPNNNTRNVAHNDKKEFAAAFLDRLPKIPSHYCRASTSKEYLEPIIDSKSELYRIYIKVCQTEEKGALARKQFLQIFKDKNLGLFQPKKDQCDTCIGYKHKQVSEEEYAQHIKRKEERREQKKQEKEKSIRGEQLTFTMDLQAVKLSPMLKASALYYKMKLCVHNFTLHNIATKDVTCYLWNESEGGLVAAVFASCVTDFLENEIGNNYVNSVVIISDGCTYQNRNAILGNALLKFAIEMNVTITQHYLEKGHTQMEVDSVHSTIEGKLKNKEIYLPSDYARICKEARPKQPYKVKYLDYTFFKDFSAIHYVPSVRPGKGLGDPVVTDICSYKYSPQGEIHYKINVTDEWVQLPQRIKKGPFELPQLYPARLKVSGEKFRHLQELKKVIPRDCHGYYDELPHL